MGTDLFAGIQETVRKRSPLTIVPDFTITGEFTRGTKVGDCASGTANIKQVAQMFGGDDRSCRFVGEGGARSNLLLCL